MIWNSVQQKKSREKIAISVFFYISVSTEENTFSNFDDHPI